VHVIVQRQKIADKMQAAPIALVQMHQRRSDRPQGDHAIIGEMGEWSPAYRVLQLITLGQIALCATVAVMGMLGGIQYHPSPNDESNVGAALIFAAILFGALGAGLAWFMLLVRRQAPMARLGVLLAEVIFMALSALFFAPVAVIFGAVAAVSCLLLPVANRS
jgi:hypothetical protein